MGTANMNPLGKLSNKNLGKIGLSTRCVGNFQLLGRGKFDCNFLTLGGEFDCRGPGGNGVVRPFRIHAQNVAT